MNHHPSSLLSVWRQSRRANCLPEPEGKVISRKIAALAVAVFVLSLGWRLKALALADTSTTQASQHSGSTSSSSSSHLVVHRRRLHAHRHHAVHRASARHTTVKTASATNAPLCPHRTARSPVPPISFSESYLSSCYLYPLPPHSSLSPTLLESVDGKFLR